MPDLDLPRYPHVVYQRQHLSQVMCQVRFHPILRISTEPPADFQERLRHHYPVLNDETPVFSFKIGTSASDLVQGDNRRWIFGSEDGKWSVVLTRDFMTLRTEEYLHYRDFAERFNHCLSALEAVYKVEKLRRIGLRYTNSFPSEAGPPEVVLNEFLAGLFRSPLATSINVGKSQYLLDAGGHQVAVRVGLGDKPIPDAREHEDEDRLILDFDHFLDGDIDLSECMDKLASFHDVNFRLFRWATTEHIHEEMEPLDG